ncbi:hypothetical protein IL252_08225 [Halomicrobium sp. IBSBa]|uniref:hypothetical protein n=1 Tax=Halomicrobium sp. IBSBa TaxID=2778916 RepID=UPI001ABF1D27|nr:hypothetical protein [Halomicrobium sp. IBSBa]MBO4247799.1 hypothetical protein [Halomicrobium sp. IBSBa]
MSPEQQRSDGITDAVLSDSAYERVRVLRDSLFAQPIPWKLRVQGLLLAVLAATVPLYWLYPDGVASYLTTTDPMTATPRVALLGAFGGTMVLFSAVLLVGAALYRVEHAPLTEQQAYQVLTVEDFAGGVSLAMGGFAIAITTGSIAMGVFGGDAVGSYVATMGQNPLAGSVYGLSLGSVGIGALSASAVVLVAHWYVDRRFRRL